MPVPATGKLPAAVTAAWRAAGEPVVTPRRVPHEDAGRTAAAKAYRVLRTILWEAVGDGLLTASPCQIKGAAQTHTRERGAATPAAVGALTAGMPPRLAAAVTLAAWSGLRYGELFALSRRGVDPGSGHSASRADTGSWGGFGPTKTPKSRRTVHVPRRVADTLAAHLAEHVGADPDALLFTLDCGAPVSSSRLSRIFAGARADVGRKDLTWHDLRHTGATLAYRAGASVPDVQRRLACGTLNSAGLQPPVSQASSPRSCPSSTRLAPAVTQVGSQSSAHSRCRRAHMVILASM